MIEKGEINQEVSTNDIKELSINSLIKLIDDDKVYANKIGSLLEIAYENNENKEAMKKFKDSVIAQLNRIGDKDKINQVDFIRFKEIFSEVEHMKFADISFQYSSPLAYISSKQIHNKLLFTQLMLFNRWKSFDEQDMMFYRATDPTIFEFFNNGFKEFYQSSLELGIHYRKDNKDAIMYLFKNQMNLMDRIKINKIINNEETSVIDLNEKYVAVVNNDN